MSFGRYRESIIIVGMKRSCHLVVKVKIKRLRFATEYKYVTIEGGTLDGKYSAGVYPIGTKLTPSGDGVSAWSDGSGAILSGAEYTVSANATLVAENAKDLATETFENATSNSLPSNISFVGNLPKIGNLGNSYATSGYAVGKFTNNDTNSTNCLYTSNKYAASKAIIKVTESATADSAIALDDVVNAYIIINGKNGGGAHAINSYVAIDNVVFRKIADSAP